MRSRATLLLTLTATFTLLAGCSHMDAPTPPRIDVPRAPEVLYLTSGNVTYYLANPVYHLTSGQITCDAHIVSPSSLNTTITITPLLVDSTVTGSEVVVRNASGTLLFRLACNVTSLEDTTYVLEESCGTDSLTFTRSKSSGSMVEHYVLDGTATTFSWPIGSQASDSLVAAIDAFLPDASPLINHPYGMMAARVVTSADFREWLSSSQVTETGLGLAHAMSWHKMVNAFCAGLGITCGYKCLVWPLNPLCVDCGVAGLGCALYGLWCLNHPCN